MRERHFGMERLLRPVEPARFFQNYWGQQSLILLRNNPRYYAGLFTMRDVDVVLRCGHLRYPDIQLTRQDKAALPREMYVGMGTTSPQDSGVPDVNQLYSAYAQGGYFSCAPTALGDYCRLVPKSRAMFHASRERRSLPGAQGLPGLSTAFHPYDDFVLQLEGGELWRPLSYLHSRPFIPAINPSPRRAPPACP